MQELPPTATLVSTMPQRCGIPLLSPHAQLTWQLIATSQQGIVRHGPYLMQRQGQQGVSRTTYSLSLQHLYLPEGLQVNLLLPGGSLVGLGGCLSARCVGEELLPLATCCRFPHCLCVKGILNSKPSEVQSGESLVRSIPLKQTVPGHFLAQQQDCPHGNF